MNKKFSIHFYAIEKYQPYDNHSIPPTPTPIKMYAPEELIKRFIDRISLHAYIVRRYAKQNLLNRAVLSESLCQDIANILLNRKFRNSNLKTPNHDTIDLYDDEQSPPVCAQVTIRTDRKKIDETLSNFIEKEYYKNYSEIYFFILGERQTYNNNKYPFRTDGLFNFDPKKHIISVDDMISMARNLSIEELENLVKKTEQYINTEGKVKQTQYGKIFFISATLIAILFYFEMQYRDNFILIPGNNLIEKKINQAKIEGATATTESADFAVVIPFARPSLTKEDAPDGVTNVIALSNSSPLKSKNQDLVFSAGRCRFIGSITWEDKNSLTASASITSLNCVLDNRDTYELQNKSGIEIGFLEPINAPATRRLRLIKEDNVFTLPKEEKYLLRLAQPIQDLEYKGKSVIAW